MPLGAFDYLGLLECLVAADVDFVLIGGVCAVAHGAPVTTFDLDVLYAKDAENIDRILSALAAIHAYHREPGSRRLSPQRHTLESGGPALFMTDLGSLDFLGDLSGREISSLRGQTDEFELRSGSTLKLKP